MTLRMVYGPESLDEKIGVVKMEAERNLHDFKELIEGRGVETGAWRGTLRGARCSIEGGSVGFASLTATLRNSRSVS